MADSSLSVGSSDHWSGFSEDKSNVSTNQAYIGGPSSPAVVVQSSGDEDVLSHLLIASRESTLKALWELNDSLMKEKDKIIDDNAIVYDKIFSLEGQITALILEITEIIKDIEVLKTQRT